MRRTARDGRLDALLVLAVPELDQGVFVQPQPRDFALFGRLDQRGRAGAQFLALGKADEAVALVREIELRRRFGLQVGDTMRFDILGRVMSARVVSVRHVDWSDGRAGGFATSMVNSPAR